MEQFATLDGHQVHLARARVFFAVGMAFTLCLRVSDVAKVRWEWLQYPKWFIFYHFKVCQSSRAIISLCRRTRHVLGLHCPMPLPHDAVDATDAWSSIASTLMYSTSSPLVRWVAVAAGLLTVPWCVPRHDLLR